MSQYGITRPQWVNIHFSWYHCVCLMWQSYWLNSLRWSNAYMRHLIGPFGTNFSEISIKIHIFSFKKMHLKVSSANWELFYCGLNVLIVFVDQKLLDDHLLMAVSRVSQLWHRQSWTKYDLQPWKKFISLTHCDLGTPYGATDLGQHWLR